MAHLSVVGVAPAADTNTTLRTAAGDEVWFVDVVNRGAGTAEIRVAIRPGGASLANQHYRMFDTPLPAGESIPRLGPFFVQNGDVATVRASTANVTFTSDGSA